MQSSLSPMEPVKQLPPNAGGTVVMRKCIRDIVLELAALAVAAHGHLTDNAPSLLFMNGVARLPGHQSSSFGRVSFERSAILLLLHESGIRKGGAAG